MSRTFTELAAILAVVGLGGTAWNYHNRNDDTKFLPWIAGQRPAQCLAKGTPAPTPDAKAPGLAAAPGTEPSAPGKAEAPPRENGAWGFPFIDHAEAVAHFNDGVTFFIDARRTSTESNLNLNRVRAEFLARIAELEDAVGETRAAGKEFPR